MAKKTIKTEYTDLVVEMVAGQRIEILLKYIDSNKLPIDISSLEFVSEWVTTKAEVISSLSSTDVGNNTGSIEKSPADGINAFKVIITDTLGFSKGSGTLDIWVLDSSFTPTKRIPIVYGQWKSVKFPTNFVP